MFDRKFWIGAVVVLVVSMTFGLLVHGIWLDADYKALPNIMRSKQDAAGMMGFMTLAHVLIALAFTWIYRVGRREGDWIGQGLRFGLAVAVLSNIPFFLIYHSVAQFPIELVVKQSIGDTIGVLCAGLAVAFVHR